MNTPFKYRAFISYSHRDERWASWLHKSLETYRVPKHLVGTDHRVGVVPARFAPIFRDRDELATATNLGDDADRALRAVAVPDRHLLDGRGEVALGQRGDPRLQAPRARAPHLLPAGRRRTGLVAGAGTAEMECFPQALMYTMGADGKLTTERSEPIAADVRPNKDGKNDARLKLLAGMLGVGLDDLKRARSASPTPPHLALMLRRPSRA